MARPLRVLLVEDNPGDVRLVRESLARTTNPRFDLAHVGRLDAALELLEKRRYDVVLLDLLLADSDRLSTLMRIHSKAAQVPIVVYSGMDDEVVSLWAVSEGAANYLAKADLDSGSLIQSLQDAVDSHRTLVSGVAGGPTTWGKEELK